MNKEQIVNALKNQKSEFESPCFVKMAMKGGIENYVRDCLFDELYKENKNIETEFSFNPKGEKINRVDIIAWNDKKNKNVDYIIELGTNGTWQPPNFGSNHANKDQERAKQYIHQEFESFTVTTIIDILQVPDQYEHWLRKSYKNPILKRIKNKEVNNINEWDSAFYAIDNNCLSFVTTGNWNGVIVSVKFYVCQFN
jgi:hypothetical protein